MEFKKEYKVKGNLLEGEIIGNWSKDSEYTFRIIELKEFKLGEKELNELVYEMNEVAEMVAKLNKEHKEQ